jgi:hypothetical protein
MTGSAPVPPIWNRGQSMSYQERRDLVEAVEETYALMGRSLGADIPELLIRNAVRPDILIRLSDVRMDSYVTDTEMLALFLEAYNDTVESVLRLSQLLLGDGGQRFDARLGRVGLTGSSLRLKVGGFRRSFGQVLLASPGFRWIKKTFEWGNIILGSLGAIPAIGIITEPIHELKQSIEAQGDEENSA